MPTLSSVKTVYSNIISVLEVIPESIFYAKDTIRRRDDDFCTCADDREFPFGNLDLVYILI